MSEPTTPQGNTQDANLEPTKGKAGRPKKSDQASPMLKAAIIGMRESGLEKDAIAKELNCSMTKVENALRDHKSVEKKDLDLMRANFAGNIAGLIQKMLLSADQNDWASKVAKMTGNSTFAISMGVLIDKMNVLSNMPTEILEVQERVKDVQAQLAAIRAHREQLESLKKSLNGTDNPTAN